MKYKKCKIAPLYLTNLKDGGFKDALCVDESLGLSVARRDGHDAIGVRQDAVPREQHRPRRQQHALSHRLESKK